MTFFQLRGVADRLLRARDWRLLRWLWSSWCNGKPMPAEEWPGLKAQFEAPGVEEAALGYYRHNATPPILLGLRSTPAMERIPIDVPSLIIHGSDDGCLDRRLFDQTIKDDDFPRGVTRIELEDAGHFVHRERPDDVNTALLGFLV